MSARLEAAKRGELFYESVPCRVCGGFNRYTSTGGCVVCSARRSANRNKAISEALRAAREAKKGEK